MCSHLTFSQNELFHRATIFLDNKSISELSNTGIDVLEGNYRPGVSFTSDFSEDELLRIKNNGFRYEINIHDVSTFYKKQNDDLNVKKSSISSCNSNGSPNYNVPVNFSYGSMGGYFTYSEMIAILNNMASLYPNLITVKQAIPGGTSVEGEPIYWIKISDNPNVDESEPEVLYTSLHHAREPGGLSNLIFYMWYLLENYQSNSEIQSLVNATEMYFIPCVNPDGYFYNEATDPAGGGMWRKNRKDNLDGSYGIDLNRNYGYNWGFNNSGSSPFTADETYRGTSPFSEPETQLVKSFVESRNFKLALNYHSYGNLLVYPWSYIDNFYTPDSARYAEYGSLLSKYNLYSAGTPNQTVGYLVNGCSDDWMYGEQSSKPKVFAFTPEVGDAFYGFWPPMSEIIPICLENLWSNITTAKLAGPYAKASAYENLSLNSLNSYINYNFQNLGLDSNGTFTVSILPLSANIISTGSPIIYNNLTSLQNIQDSVSINISSSIHNGDTVRFILQVDNGNFTENDTIEITYGNTSVFINDNGNNLSNWASSTAWGTTNETYFSPGTSITDSPFNFYLPNDVNTLTLANNINLTNCVSAELSFHTRWNIDPSYDYLQILASPDNGFSWTPLCGLYTKDGINSQPNGEPIYDGFQNTWLYERINLSDFAGTSVKIKFELVSDAFYEYDGFYFDDLKVTGLTATGFNENILENSVSIFPNPVNDKLNFSVNKINKGRTIEIYNTHGAKVHRERIDGSSANYSLSVSAYNNGMYIYNIISDSGIISKGKFIVQH